MPASCTCPSYRRFDSRRYVRRLSSYRVVSVDSIGPLRVSCATDSSSSSCTLGGYQRPHVLQPFGQGRTRPRIDTGHRLFVSSMGLVMPAIVVLSYVPSIQARFSLQTRSTEPEVAVADYCSELVLSYCLYNNEIRKDERPKGQDQPPHHEMSVPHPQPAHVLLSTVLVPLLLSE